MSEVLKEILIEMMIAEDIRITKAFADASQSIDINFHWWGLVVKIIVSSIAESQLHPSEKIAQMETLMDAIKDCSKGLLEIIVAAQEAQISTKH